MTRRFLRMIVLAIAALSVLPVAPARANHCKTSIDIEVRYAGTEVDGVDYDAAVNGEKGWVCPYMYNNTGQEVAPYIEPGGQEIRIGYWAILNNGTAVINGVGFTNKTVRFTESVCFFICISYTPWMKLPLTPSGKLTVRMPWGESACFPTIGSSC